MKHYLPNLFHYLTDNEFQKLLDQLYQNSRKSDTPISVSGFGSSLSILIKELQLNQSFQIRYEFAYFNYLLGEFLKYTNQKEFKSLLRSILFNLKVNNFHHALGEVAVCLELVQGSNFIKYESKLPNGASADFEFSLNDGSPVYVDVYTIGYNREKYERENFEKYFNKKLLEKYIAKTKGLTEGLKSKIYIYPIISGITSEIIKEQFQYLKDLENSSLQINSYQSFSPKVFGSIQGTFFNLFSIEEIANPDLIKSKYGL